MEERALKPNLKSGRGILSEASKSWGEYLLLTTGPVWENSKKLISRKPAYLYFVDTMELSAIERAEKRLPRTETVVGIGGGMAIDFAKFIAWKRGQEPILVPSAISVDAPVCTSIAVRAKHRVRYIGRVLAREIICDFELVQTAPIRLNRAGIGDILSIHTALFDWKLANEQGKAEYNQKIAQEAEELLKELEIRAGEIKQGTETGLRWLLEAYVKENALCIRNGNSRPEEGSEHFFAYSLEYLTKRNYIHGELVCLGVLLMARLQENNPEWVEKILKQTGVKFQPKDLGISRRELIVCLKSLKQYVKKEGLVYSIINEKPENEKCIKLLNKRLKFLI